MDVIAKVLLTAVTLGISCGGTPWLLRQINSSSSKNKSRPLVKRSVSASSVKTAPISPAARSIESVPKAPEGKSVHPPAISVPAEVEALAPQPPVKTDEKNCSVVNQVEELETLLSNNFDLNGNTLVDTNTFVKVNCSNTTSDSSSKMPSEWEGLFPKSLFENKEGITIGSQIEIKTQTSEDSDKFRTTFSGSHFLEKIVGEWTNTGPNKEEKTVTEVRITSTGRSSEKIYLLFKK